MKDVVARFNAASAALVTFFLVEFMRLRQPSRRRGLIIGVLAALSIGTGAVAYWSSVGAGSGTGAVGTALPMTLTAGTATGWLHPGGQADVAVTISNPNPFSVRARWLSLDVNQGTGGYWVDGGHAACGVSSLSFAAQSNSGLGWTVAPKVGGVDGTLAVDLTGALSLSLGAPDACQGATFRVYLIATADYQLSILGTSGLVSYWRLGAEATVADSFTGTAGTALSAHTGEISASWVHQSGSSGAVLTDQGRVRKNGTGGGSLDYTSTSPSSTDYSVQADLYNATNLTGDKTGVVGRLDVATGNYYLAWFDSADNGFHVMKMTSSTATSLGCWCAGGALTAGQTYHLRLDMTGTASTVLKLYVDGVLRTTATDTSSPYTAIGKAGLQDGDTAATATKTNSTGLQPDNFRVVPATGTAVTDSVGANSGTFSGSPLLNVPGAVAGGFNTAVRWDGSSMYASVPDANTLDLGDGSTPFTLEAWVQRHDSGSGRQTILDKGTGSFQWAFDANSMALYKDGAQIVKTTSTQTDLTSFHHYAVTKNGSAVKLYVDGLDVTGTVTDHPLTSNASALYFGSKGGSSEYLNGSQDEVAAYNVVLSATTIREHYRNGLAA
jgi:hypothetical protein